MQEIHINRENMMPTDKPKQSKPKPTEVKLGTGMAEKARQSLKNRKDTIEETLRKSGA